MGNRKCKERLQKNIPHNLRKYYKRSRKLILTLYHKLKDENKKAEDLMLLYNDDHRIAHKLKAWFYEIYQSAKYSAQRTALYDWIQNAELSEYQSSKIAQLHIEDGLKK